MNEIDLFVGSFFILLYNTLMQEGQHTTGDQPSAGWQFKPENQSNEQGSVSSFPNPARPDSGVVSWTASEFVVHQKSAGWYARLVLAAVVACTLIYIFTKDVISSGMIIVAALVLAVFAARQPRTLQYKVNNQGITIGDKLYSYFNFRSFSVIDEDAISSIIFMPLKRFMPSITVYYAQKDEESILGILSDHLPFEQREHDAVDKFMKRIRF